MVARQEQLRACCRALVASCSRKGRLVAELQDALAHFGGLMRVKEQAVFAIDNGVEYAASACGDHGQAASHRLQCNQPKRLRRGRKDKCIGGAIGVDQCLPA